jgi:hypothetical protein
LEFVKTELDQVRDTIWSRTNYSQKYELYTCTQKIDWSYSKSRPYKGDTLKSERRMYLHFYYNSDQAMEDEKEFNSRLSVLQTEIESGKRNPENEKLYNKYFDIKTTPVRGTNTTSKQKAMDEAKMNYGYFALISNEIKDPIEALEIYRNKDLVEKAFRHQPRYSSFGNAGNNC